MPRKGMCMRSLKPRKNSNGELIEKDYIRRSVSRTLITEDLFTGERTYTLNFIKLDPDVYPFVEVTLEAWAVCRKTTFSHGYIYTSCSGMQRMFAVGADTSDSCNIFKVLVGKDRKITIRVDSVAPDRFELCANSYQSLQ